MTLRYLAIAICVVALLGLSGGGGNLHAQDASEVTFTVRIENVSGGNTETYSQVGIFSTPVDETVARPAMPGEAYEFTVKATAGSYLSFATMYGESNDTFFATQEEGIALFDENGDLVGGDVTDQVGLWDAGTEENEPLGQGLNQAPRQTAPDTGPDGEGSVAAVEDSDEFPAVADLISVTLDVAGINLVLVRIENLSGSAFVPTGFSPGIYVVHTQEQSAPFFIEGEADRGEGLEALAEDGNPEALGAMLAGSGPSDVGVSPGVYVIHNDSQLAPLFTPGEADSGQGLESLAEDGDPTQLGELVADMDFSQSGVFDTAVDATAVGALMPGQAFEFSFTAVAGERLTFVVMFGQSNDWFFAPNENGITLFSPNGSPRSGLATGEVYLWDAGTEVNQPPFVGPDQAPRQAAPNTGESEDGVVQPVYAVDDESTDPNVLSSIQVTISNDSDMESNMMAPPSIAAPAETPTPDMAAATATPTEVSASTTLSGAEEVPGPGDPDGTGTASVTFNTSTNEVCWQMNVQNITLPASAAHIHAAPVGVAGDVVVPLTAPDASGAASGCAVVDAALLADLMANPTNYYVNVHTSDYPDGAVRGQLNMAAPPPPPPSPTAMETPTATLPPAATPTATEAGTGLGATLSGAEEVPGPGDPDGTGTASVTLNASTNEVCFNLSVQNITLPASAAHIHAAPAGTAGGVVVPLTAPDASGAASGCAMVDASLLADLMANPGNYYVNVHTSDYPDGAVRGQLSGGQ